MDWQIIPISELYYSDFMNSLNTNSSVKKD